MSLKEGPGKVLFVDQNVKKFGEHYDRKGAFVEHPITTFPMFFNLIGKCIERTTATWEENGKIDPDQALMKCRELFKACHKRGNKLIFIGNGGSAAIASHMAVDYTKNGKIRAIAFNDAPTLTCLANDFGYENVFSKQLEYYARDGDIVVIISSSGKSQNIINAAREARPMGCDLITFSGMNPNNSLRRRGLYNFYVPSVDYGLVELTHLCLLHSIVSVS